jgi:hypothetical protein
VNNGLISIFPRCRLGMDFFALKTCVSGRFMAGIWFGGLRAPLKFKEDINEHNTKA